MNFLCHSEIALYVCQKETRLQGLQESLLAGAILGDFLKGPLQTDWGEGLTKGIKLHRKIDAISNFDPIIKITCNRFPKNLRRIAPILVDIISDHFLALNWHRFQQIPLQVFSRECCQVLEGYSDKAGDNFTKFFKHMKRTELLRSNEDWSTIEATIFGILKRLKRENEHSQICKLLANIKGEALQDFSIFYPKLRAASLKWASNNQN